MGTDLFIRKEIEQGTDKQGRRMFSKVEVANFGHCSDIVDEINWHVGGLANCTSAFIEGKEFLEIKDELQKSREELETRNPAEYTYRESGITDEEYEKACEEKKKSKISSYDDQLDELNTFIEEENITEDNEETYEVHLWF